MELTDLKLSKKESTDNMPIKGASSYDGPKYPYGTVLNFDTVAVKKIKNLQDLKVGDEVDITAKGKIISVRTSERRNNENSHNVEIQVEQFACEPKKPLEKMNPSEYRKAREAM